MALKFIPPCIPRPSVKPPSGNAWEHQAKLDGFRIQILKDGDSVRLFTERGFDETKRLEALADALRQLPCQTSILDGELCFPHPAGVPRFRDLYAAFSRWRAHLLEIYAFDVMHLDGEDLCDLPLVERRERLKALMARSTVPCLHLVTSFENGENLLSAAENLGLEGIVSKRKDAPYRSGPHSSWRKTKTKSWRDANRHRFELFKRGDGESGAESLSRSVRITRCWRRSQTILG